MKARPVTLATCSPSYVQVLFELPLIASFVLLRIPKKGRGCGKHTGKGFSSIPIVPLEQQTASLSNSAEGNEL